MTRSNLKILNISIFIVLLISCGKEEKSNLLAENEDLTSIELLPDAEYIKYGTSFNMCIGYCYRNLIITDSVAGFEKNGRDLQGNLPKICLAKPIDNEYWKKLLEAVDIESFTQLDLVLGCPDCADGGAEWIEIKTGEIKHKVTFEYRNEPEAVKSLAEYLRTCLNSFESE